MKAARKGHLGCARVVQMLLEAGTDVALRNAKGSSALELCKSEEIARMLRAAAAGGAGASGGAGGRAAAAGGGGGGGRRIDWGRQAGFGSRDAREHARVHAGLTSTGKDATTLDEYGRRLQDL